MLLQDVTRWNELILGSKNDRGGRESVCVCVSEKGNERERVCERVCVRVGVHVCACE